jgi:hypothetical protein
MQEIVKKKAPVQATGGAGFRYENAVAARFLLDLLGGTNALGVNFGRITRIDWQARDSGWLADDLVITYRDLAGDRRTAALSIKSARQVTRAGFPENFAMGNALSGSRGCKHVALAQQLAAHRQLQQPEAEPSGPLEIVDVMLELKMGGLGKWAKSSALLSCGVAFGRVL